MVHVVYLVLSGGTLVVIIGDARTSSFPKKGQQFCNEMRKNEQDRRFASERLNVARQEQKGVFAWRRQSPLMANIVGEWESYRRYASGGFAYVILTAEQAYRAR